MTTEAIAALSALVGADGAVLLPITAIEIGGHNAVPDAMAELLADRLKWRLSLGDIVQVNKVGHTKALAFNRIVTPAAFEGPVIRGANYVLVDDHVGLGGTLANLKGHVETNGGIVVAMTTLTESRQARHIALRSDVLGVLKAEHGDELENLWRDHFGHGLEQLTNVEGENLRREHTVDAIRNRLAQAEVEVRERGIAVGKEPP
ncbi:MAG TPA: hypothetical protein VHW60_07410 [Caulobacteraceae bacterium]|jgi:hypothetical protein|nr:hypothetical protein [Caulobacteraceae bacterium]